MRLSAVLFVFAFAKRTWQKRRCLCAVGLLSGCFVLGPSTLHANEKVASLCALQDNAKEGERVTAQVAGVYFSGLDMGPLEDANCPANATWVELALQSEVNKKKLRGLLERYGRAYVVFDGEFYGPPVPDPKLPEAIRKAYHPGWGHLASFRTKLVVHSIRVVERAPAEVAGHADNLNLVAERLARVGIFAFGGVGYAGVISKGETDFRFILSQQTAVHCVGVVREAICRRQRSGEGLRTCRRQETGPRQIQGTACARRDING
jgi:hypothetical protein